MSTPMRHPVAQTDEIADGGKKIVAIPYRNKEIELGIFRLGDEYFAYRNVCPHAGAPVCEGKVCGTTLPSKVYEYEYSEEKKVLRCPWHGWEFDLRTGKHLVDERMKLRGYPVEANDGAREGTTSSKSEDLESYSVETDSGTIYVLLPA